MPAMPRYFEEIAVGDGYEVDETYEVDREEIVEFAEQYDPQPFHTDPEAAEDSIFGGLVASGWHTCAMAMRLVVDGFLNESGAQGAVGADDLRWHEPVRPGDVLRLEGEVVEKGPWSDSLGLVRSRTELFATGEDRPEDGDRVMSYVALVLWERAAPPG